VLGSLECIQLNTFSESIGASQPAAANQNDLPASDSNGARAPETHVSQPRGYPFKMKAAALIQVVLFKAPVIGGRAAGADTKCSPKYGGVDSELKRAGGGLPSPQLAPPAVELLWLSTQGPLSAVPNQSAGFLTRPKQTAGAEYARNVGLVLV